MLANQRLLFGSYEDGDFGFRQEIPSGRIETPFLNNEWILENLGEQQFVHGDNRPVLVTCGVTYINALTLNDDEADYYHAFKALMEEVGLAALRTLSHFQFAPTLPHQKHPTFELSRRFDTRLSRLENLLKAGWLHPRATDPFCRLLPFDHEIPKVPKPFSSTGSEART